METIEDWCGKPIEVVKSEGGVLAVAHPWDNVIKAGIKPWPPSELLQKVYQSNHAGAYTAAATAKIGFYSDLQSLHSEDAITWSFFGPLAYAPLAVRNAFVKDLLALIDVQGSAASTSIRARWTCGENFACVPAR